MCKDDVCHMVQQLWLSPCRTHGCHRNQLAHSFQRHDGTQCMKKNQRCSPLTLGIEGVVVLPPGGRPQPPASRCSGLRQYFLCCLCAVSPSSPRVHCCCLLAAGPIICRGHGCDQWGLNLHLCRLSLCTAGLRHSWRLAACCGLCLRGRRDNASRGICLLRLTHHSRLRGCKLCARCSISCRQLLCRCLLLRRWYLLTFRSRHLAFTGHIVKLQFALERCWPERRWQIVVLREQGCGYLSSGGSCFDVSAACCSCQECPYIHSHNRRG